MDNPQSSQNLPSTSSNNYQPAIPMLPSGLPRHIPYPESQTTVPT